MLQARQYDIGPTGVDGIFGPMTLFAVKAFQKDHHLSDDGVVNGPT
jgi:peptidoglycan hydrolase-like protein with peptidoglycan-binding domain